MAIGRRQFIGCVGSIPFVGAMAAFAAEKPLLRMGVLTDTHIGETKASCRRVKQACRLFRNHGVDMIVNVGDVADYHYPSGYKAYRETVNEVYAKIAVSDRPEELFVYAAHDFFKYKNSSRKDWQRHATAAFADMQRLIGASNGPYAQGLIKGFPYVVLPQTMTEGLDLARCERMIADAAAANPGKPVFVFTHVPPANTTRTGRGHPEKTKMFSRYPQVVNISGHTHGSLSDERAIWQGAFTSVNAGCLQNWGDGRDGIVGSNVQRINNYGALIVDVYASRIVFRRFDVRDSEEYHAENPWVVPWPHDPATAPYALERRNRNMPKPAFATDASLKLSPLKTGGVLLTVPAAVGEPRPFAYRVCLERRAANGKWLLHARRDFFGDAWQRKSERPEKYEMEFADAYFCDGGRYRFRVSPVNFIGKEGKCVSLEYGVPAPAAAPAVWESSDPMKDCPFLFGLAGNVPVPRNGDFYEMDGRDARLVFPKGVWKGAKGAKFRFVADIHTVQEHLPAWTLVLRNPKPLKNATGRVSTPSGDSGMLRYVFEFEKLASDHDYYLLVREGCAGKIRFGRIRIERVSAVN